MGGVSKWRSYSWNSSSALWSTPRCLTQEADGISLAISAKFLIRTKWGCCLTDILTLCYPETVHLLLIHPLRRPATFSGNDGPLFIHFLPKVRRMTGPGTRTGSLLLLSSWSCALGSGGLRVDSALKSALWRVAKRRRAATQGRGGQELQTEGSAPNGRHG